MICMTNIHHTTMIHTHIISAIPLIALLTNDSKINIFVLLCSYKIIFFFSCQKYLIIF